MSFRLLMTLLIGGLTLTLIWSFGNGPPAFLGISMDDAGSLVYLGLLLAFLAIAFAGRAIRPRQVVQAATFWTMLGAILVAAYAYRVELSAVGGRLLGALAPGFPVTGDIAGESGQKMVTVTRGGGGHFAILGSVEDEHVMFLVDTGASFVTLTSHDAVRVGYNLDSLTFSLPIRTANGMIRAAPITIGKLRIGAIEREDVPALVSPPATLEQSLLGLTFLDSLQSYTVAGDRLILAP